MNYLQKSGLLVTISQEESFMGNFLLEDSDTELITIRLWVVYRKGFDTQLCYKLLGKVQFDSSVVDMSIDGNNLLACSVVDPCKFSILCKGSAKSSPIGG